MGYTHYINQSRNLTDQEWEKFKQGAKKIVKKYENILADGLGEKYSAPVLTNKEFYFNGIEEQAHETCSIFKEKQDFSFECKTARKPYDVAVVETYLLAREVAPDAFQLSSDGDGVFS